MNESEERAVPEAKTKPASASVAAYLNAIDDEERRKDCRQISALMKRVTGRGKVTPNRAVEAIRNDGRHASGRVRFMHCRIRAAVPAGIIVTAVLASSPGCAHHKAASSAGEAEEQRVLAAEDEYVAAEVSRDEEALRRLVDDRFVFNSSHGTTSGKEELIQSVLKMNMVGQSVRERSVLIEGDLAFVFGTADLRFASPGEAESVSTLRYTAAYVKRHGQWRMLVLQMQQRAPDPQR